MIDRKTWRPRGHEAARLALSMLCQKLCIGSVYRQMAVLVGNFVCYADTTCT